MNKNKKILLVATATVLAVALGLIGYRALSDVPFVPLKPAVPHPQPQLFIDGSQFTVGANYPWGKNCGFGVNSWGHTGISTPSCSVQTDQDFAQLEAAGVHVVRWWLFADFRTGLKLDQSGNIVGVDDYVFPDMDEAVRLAAKHNIKIIFVLVDFMIFDKPQVVGGVQIFGRRDLIVDPVKRQALLDKVFKPIFERYGQNGTIIAWDVINEPEWSMFVHTGEWIVPDRVDVRIMQSFVNETVDYIHRYTEQWATVGSAKRGLLKLWTHSHLDFYQFHYYDKMERQYPLDYPVAKLKLDKPVIVGEFPTAKTKRTVFEHLTIIHKNGYVGAFPWSFNASDPYTSPANLVAGITQFLNSLKPKP